MSKQGVVVAGKVLVLFVSKQGVVVAGKVLVLFVSKQGVVVAGKVLVLSGFVSEQGVSCCRESFGPLCVRTGCKLLQGKFWSSQGLCQNRV